MTQQNGPLLSQVMNVRLDNFRIVFYEHDIKCLRPYKRDWCLKVTVDFIAFYM